MGTARSTFKTLNPKLTLPYSYNLTESDADNIRFIVNPQASGIFMGSVEHSSSIPWMNLNSYNITIDTNAKLINISMSLSVP